MTTDSACGTCTLCCKLMPFKAVEGDRAMVDGGDGSKPAGTWCMHCIKGDGCRINYAEDRPAACGAFECMWLMSQDRQVTSTDGLPPQTLAMAPNLRPDKCRAVIEILRDRFVLHVDPGFYRDKPWENGALGDAVKSWDAAGIKVFVVCATTELAVSRAAVNSLRRVSG